MKGSLTPMAVTRRLSPGSPPDDGASRWKRRRDIPLAILAWIGVLAVVIWGATHIVRVLLLLVIAALLAYALAPLVTWLQRVVPRPLAIVVTCLVVLALLALLVYLITTTALHQFSSLSRRVAYLLTPEGGKTSPIEQTLLASGVTKVQIASFRSQVVTRLEGIVGGSLPIVTRILDFLLDIVVVAVISIYLLIDGGRIAIWCRRNLPATVQADFILDTLQRVVGGYIRGQVILAVLIGLLVGIGMALFHVPYALLLGVLAFILEFIPILGTLVSGVICTLLALTQGWVIALCVLIYFIVVHVLEGDIIGPRIVGEAIGLHPIVSIAAIIAGSELFGVVGALLASPIAGMIQVFIVALWVHWRTAHPEHFAVTPADSSTTDGATPNGADSP
jgi:predicted PurR-regulated permease PerM